MRNEPGQEDIEGIEYRSGVPREGLRPEDLPVQKWSGTEIPSDVRKAIVHEDLLPQYDTVNKEPYFVRESDGRVFSLEEAGQYFIDRDAGRNLIDEDGLPDLEEADFEDDFEPSQWERDSENQHMLRRHKQLRIAAEAVAAAMSQLAEVEKAALFG